MRIGDVIGLTGLVGLSSGCGMSSSPTPTTYEIDYTAVASSEVAGTGSGFDLVGAPVRGLFEVEIPPGDDAEITVRTKFCDFEAARDGELVRASAAKCTYHANTTLLGYAKNRTFEEFVLDPENGRAYWVQTDEKADGSGRIRGLSEGWIVTVGSEPLTNE